MNGNCWKLGRGKRVLLSLAIIATAFAGLNWFDRVRAEAPEVAGPPIEYDHLANQETDPFLFSGKLMDENHPQWGRYRKALREYSDVRDCLIESEKLKDSPNLLHINWQELKKRADIEVCLFRIFRSFNSANRIQKWMQIQEMNPQNLVRFVSEAYNTQSQTEPVAGISGSWSAEETLKRLPTFMWRVFGWTLLQGTAFAVQFSENGEIVGVGISYTYE